jgi:hypothetical protein
MLSRKTLGYVAALACCFLALTALAAPADDKKDDKDKPALSGSWLKKEGELRLDFADKGVLKISPHNKDDVILILCEYTRAKDGRVKVKVTGLEGSAKDKVEGHVPVGLEFSFTWQVKDDAATVDDVKGEKIDVFKSHMEGKYEQKK